MQIPTSEEMREREHDCTLQITEWAGKTRQAGSICNEQKRNKEIWKKTKNNHLQKEHKKFSFYHRNTETWNGLEGKWCVLDILKTKKKIDKKLQKQDSTSLVPLLYITAW